MVLLLLVVFTTPVAGQSFVSQTGHVEFLSNVPFHSFVGSSDVLTGEIDLKDSTVDFYVDLESVRTGNRKRDKDMRKTLDTNTHPFAEFYGSLQTGVDSLLKGPQPVRVSGDFSIHGITLPIEVSGTVEFVDDELEVVSEFRLLLDDFDIHPPRLLFFKVDQEQQVSLRARLHRK